jgi:hypothetical protein
VRAGVMLPLVWPLLSLSAMPIIPPYPVYCDKIRTVTQHSVTG